MFDLIELSVLYFVLCALLVLQKLRHQSLKIYFRQMFFRETVQKPRHLAIAHAAVP